MNPDQLKLEIFPEDQPENYPMSYLPSTTEPLFIKEVHLEAFKAFKDTTVVFPGFAVLTGVNNSGKTSILQGISLAFEALRRCVDKEKWQILDSGKFVMEAESVQTNTAKELWFEGKWKPAKDKIQQVKIKVTLTNGFHFSVQLAYLYGAVNIKVVDWKKDATPEDIKKAVLLEPVFIPGHGGVVAHEELRVAAQVHRVAQIGQIPFVLRNIVKTVQENRESFSGDGRSAFEILAEALKIHFGVSLSKIKFDDTKDLELRLEYSEGNFDLDIVSAGSGFNQILKLLAVLFWKNSRIILLDEPDAHLHASLQQSFISFMRDLAEKFKFQIIMATHSRDIICTTPMDSIIPVDAKSKTLNPISSFDHLLLEFKRVGNISNPEIALLYQSKRCLFVEGESDADWLPEIASRFGLTSFRGNNQIVIFEYKGVRNLGTVINLISLFEKMIGTKIKWGILRDRDHATPFLYEKIKAEAKEKQISNFFIWEKHSIENYLLDPSLLHTCVSARAVETGKALPSMDEIKTYLSEAADIIKSEVVGKFIAEAGRDYREFQDVQNPLETAGKEVSQWVDDSMKSLDGKITVLPGGKLFGKFVEKLQQAKGINISIDSVIKHLSETSAPAELLANMKKISEI